MMNNVIRLNGRQYGNGEYSAAFLLNELRIKIENRYSI